MAFFNDGEANDLFNDYFNAPLSLSPHRLISPSPFRPLHIAFSPHRLFAPLPSPFPTFVNTTLFYSPYLSSLLKDRKESISFFVLKISIVLTHI